MSMSTTTEISESKSKKNQVAKVGPGVLKMLGISTQNSGTTLRKLNDILVLAKKLPPDDDVLDARKQLTASINAILECTSDKKERSKLVSEAQKLHDGLKTKLEDRHKLVETKEREAREKLELDAFGLGSDATREQLLTERKLAEQRRKALIERIKALEENLGKQADIFTGMQLAPPVQDEVDLQMKIGGLRKLLDEEVLTDKRAYALMDLIVTTGNHVAKVVEEYEKAYEASTEIRSQLAKLQYSDNFLTLINAFKSKDDFANSVLGGDIERLWGLLNGTPIRFAAVRNTWNRIQAESERAGKDPKAYAAGTKSNTSEDPGDNPPDEGATGTDDPSNEWQKRFDLEVQYKLKELEAALEPLGRHSNVFERRDALRQAIINEEKFKAACKILAGVVQNEIKAAGEAFNKKLKEYSDLSLQLHKQHESIKKLTYGESVFAADRKLIDVLLDSFEQAEPKNASKPDRQLCLDIDAALKLGRALWQRQHELLEMQDGATAFSDALTRVKQDFKKDDRAGTKSHLAEYFPDFRTEKVEAQAAIEKDIKKLGARKALDLILQLERELDAKIKEASTIADEVGESKTTEWRQHFALSSDERLVNSIETTLLSPALKLLKTDGLFVEFGDGKLELNAMGSSAYDSVQVYAYQAVAAALRARPFDVEAFRNKEAIFRKTVQGLSGAIELKKDHESTTDLRKPQLEWQERQVSALKDKQAKLNARYGFIASRLSSVRSEASDTNAIKQADLMLKICKRQVSEFSADMLKRIDRAFKDRVIEKVLQAKKNTDDNAPLAAIEQDLVAAIGLAESRVAAALDRFSTCVDGLELRPEGQKATKLKQLPGLVQKWNRLLGEAGIQLRGMAKTIGEYAGEEDDEDYKTTLSMFQKELENYADSVTASTMSIQSAAMKLVDTENLREETRRKARETALSAIRTRQMAIQGHPISTLLLTRPYAFGDVCLLPKRMSDQLAALEFTILTAI